MRSLIIALAATATFAVSAEAQYRQTREPFRATVTKRSYLDPGPVAPVGRYQNYVNAGHWFHPPVYSNFGDHFGAGVLPPRIGAGGGPFCCYDFRP
jgi:hypothetical protein